VGNVKDFILSQEQKFTSLTEEAMRFEKEAKFDLVFQKWQTLYNQKNLFTGALTKNLQ
jgi:hypothetical protein